MKEMKWSELYDQSKQPSMQEISGFINNILFEEFCSFIESAYCISPKLEYSKCSMQKGWNIKYKKGGKSLCTVYPMEGYFIVLIVIGKKEQTEAELILPACGSQVRKVYSETTLSWAGKWLMVEIKEREVLEDIQKLILTRAKPNK